MHGKWYQEMASMKNEVIVNAKVGIQKMDRELILESKFFVE